MANFLSRLLGSIPSTQTSATVDRSPIPKPESPVALDPHDAPAQATAWSERDASFWAQRTAYLLDRLRRAWAKTPEASAWPDAIGLLDLLAAPPEEMIRQLPSAARDAMALCSDEAVSRAQLAERLSQDPSLVQGLLRQANGAFYGAGLTPILAVDAAIDRIGVAGTRAVVLAVCVSGMLSKPGPPYESMLAESWQHMVDTGPLARLVAPEFGADPEEAFAVALLHDVGRLVIFDRISTLRASRRRPIVLPETWLALVTEQLHEALGAVAAHRWGLGARAADAIGTHHRRERPAGPHPLAEAIFLAERAALSRTREEQFDFDGVWGLGQLSGDPLVSRGILGRHVRTTSWRH